MCSNWDQKFRTRQDLFICKQRYEQRTPNHHYAIIRVLHSPPGLSRPARLGGVMGGQGGRGGTVRTAFIVAIPLGQQHLSINIAPALGADPSAGDAGVSVVVDQSGGRT